ncbi:MAG: FAD-binding oxidoreductase [Patescibacteria group bacterium]
MDLAQELSGLLRGEVHADDQTLDHYSQDASIFQVRPQVVVYPQDLHDLQELINFVRIKKDEGREISLTPRNAGSCMSGGSLTEHIMVDMSKHFVYVGDVEDRQIAVGSGTLFRDIAAKAAEDKLMFPAYTSSKDFCGIGGMLGNNASGEKSIRFGATTDNTESVHVLLADGNEYQFGPLTKHQLDQKCEQLDHEGYVYRTIRQILDDNRELIERRRPKVRKNAAGYDVWRIWDDKRKVFNLAHLFIGAQGTLGIITGAKLNLVPQPKHTQMIVIGIEDLMGLGQAVQMCLNHNPEGMEVYDKHTFNLAKQYRPGDAELAKDVDGAELVLLVQFSEVTQSRTEQVAKTVVSELAKKEYKVWYINNEHVQEAHWNIRRASFKLLKEHAHGTARACPFLEDTIVSTTHFGEFVAALEAILSDYDLTYTYHGHIGDGNLRLVPLIDVEKDESLHQIEELSRRIYDLVIAFEGSISVDHNDGLAKSPYLREMYGDEMMAIFGQIKTTLDPTGIFNPHKKTQGDLEYSRNHIARNNNAGLI